MMKVNWVGENNNNNDKKPPIGIIVAIVAAVLVLVVIIAVVANSSKNKTLAISNNDVAITNDTNVSENEVVEEPPVETVTTTTTVEPTIEESAEEVELYTSVPISAEEAEKVICETTKKWVDYQDKSWRGEIDNYIFILACVSNSLYYHDLKDFNERNLYNSYYKSGPDDPWPWERQFACAAYAIYNDEPAFNIDHYYNDILKGWYEINGAGLYYDLGGDITITNIVYPGTEALEFDGLVADCEVYFTQNWEFEGDCSVMNHKNFIAYFSSTNDENDNLTWRILDIRYE